MDDFAQNSFFSIFFKNSNFLAELKHPSQVFSECFKGSHRFQFGAVLTFFQILILHSCAKCDFFVFCNFLEKFCSDDIKKHLNVRSVMRAFEITPGLLGFEQN